MALRPLNISRLKDVVEQENEHGRVPFSITYACMNGGVVDVREKCIVCIGVDTRRKTRTIKSIASGEIRTIHDILVLRVNDSKVVVN